VACGLKVDLFDVFDHGEIGAGRELVFEGFDALGRSFSQRFDAPVIQISHVPQNLVAGGGALGEEPETYALHLSSNQKFSRDPHHHPLHKEKRLLPLKNASENSIKQRAVGSEQRAVKKNRTALAILICLPNRSPPAVRFPSITVPAIRLC
jgi:hypothetical protein